MNEERRHAPRIASRLEVEVWGRFGSNKMTDFSTDGAFIRTPKASRFKPDDQIDLALKLPTERETMLVSAQIRWTTEVGIGVKFENLAPHKARIIKDCFNAFRQVNLLEDGEGMPLKAPKTPKTQPAPLERYTEKRFWSRLTKVIKDKCKRR